MCHVDTARIFQKWGRKFTINKL